METYDLIKINLSILLLRFAVIQLVPLNKIYNSLFITAILHLRSHRRLLLCRQIANDWKIIKQQRANARELNQMDRMIRNSNCDPDQRCHVFRLALILKRKDFT